MRTPLMAFLFVLLAGAVWAAEPAPKPADDEVGLKPGFYIEPGVSALIFTGPERSLPIYSATNPALIAQSGKLLSPVEEEEVAPAARLALGFVFEDMPSWMGKDFRIEGSCNFWWVDTEETQQIPPASAAAPWVIAYLYDTGTPGTSDIWSGLIYPGDRAPAVVRESEYRYVDGNLTLKTDYVASDLISFSPSLAFMYANLDYDAEVTCVGDVEIYRLKERLDTDYVGGTIGLDLNLKPTSRLTVTIGGTVSPLWSNTNCKAYNSWEWIPPTFVDRLGFNDEDDEFTFRATGMGSVAYQPLSWFKITAFGGVEYWDKVAVVDYPTYVAGQIPFLPNTGFPKIGYESMTNFRAGLNFTFIIGK